MSRSILMVVISSLALNSNGLIQSASAEVDMKPLISNRLQGVIETARRNPEKLGSRTRVYLVLHHEALTSELLALNGRISREALAQRRWKTVSQSLRKSVSNDKEALDIFKVQNYRRGKRDIYWVWIDVYETNLIDKVVDAILEHPFVESVDVATNNIRAFEGPVESPDPKGASIRRISAENSLKEIDAVVRKGKVQILSRGRSFLVVSCDSKKQLKQLTDNLKKLDSKIERLQVDRKLENPLGLSEVTITHGDADAREVVSRLAKSEFELPIGLDRQKSGTLVTSVISKTMQEKLKDKGFQINER
ncbi:MAG: hypothetical protein H8E37_06350 [Planctomycetes bacterium]|nr:hypothetical protein [Planctomycetota bacterium]